MGWVNKPTEFLRTIESDLTDIQKEITVAALQGVILQSPVDSGAYRASHKVSVNQPDLSFNETEKDVSGQATLSKGIVKLTGLVPYSTVYVQTNCPYALKIEYGKFTAKAETNKTIGGFSKQAPKGTYGLTFTLISEKYK